MTQQVSVILMVIGVVLIIPSLIIYLVFNRMEARGTPDEVVQRVFKKKVKNAAARLDLVHIILLGIMIVGLGLLLVGVIGGISGNVKP